MRKILFVVLVVLLSLPAVSCQAVGFGIPDMIEEKVENLDEKVRKFKARQPVFDELIPFTVRVSAADTDFISSSIISPQPNDHKIYLTLDVNRPDERALVLFMADGEGKVQSSFELSSSLLQTGFDVNTDTATADHLALTDNKVFALINIPTTETDSGPLSVVHFRDPDDVSQSASPAPGFALQKGGTVPITVNTLAFDSENEIFLAGDSGVFKYSDFGIPQWSENGRDTPGQRHLNDFRVQDGNLVVLNDTPYVSSVLDTAGAGFKVEVASFRNEGGTVAWKRTIQTRTANIDGVEANLIAGNNEIFFHYQTPNGDTLMAINESGDTVWTKKYDIGSEPHITPSLYDDNTDLLYAGTADGSVRSYDASDGGRFSSLGVSDSQVRVVAQGDNENLYVGTKERDLGAVLEVEVSAGSLVDTRVVAKRESSDPPVQKDIFARPVWLKQDGLDGFLGMVVDGATLKMQSDTVAASDIRSSPWPHEDRNNQRLRRKN